MGLRLEVGNVYKRKGKLYLAVSPVLMITYVRQVLKEVRVKKGFEVERFLSVRLLLDEWGIHARELDRASYLYLYPPAHRNVGVRQRRRKRRGGATEELDIFQEIRLHKILDSHHKST